MGDTAEWAPAYPNDKHTTDLRQTNTHPNSHTAQAHVNLIDQTQQSHPVNKKCEGEDYFCAKMGSVFG